MSKGGQFCEQPNSCSTIDPVACTVLARANSDHYIREYFLYAGHQCPVKGFCILTPGVQIGRQTIRPTATPRQSQRPLRLVRLDLLSAPVGFPTSHPPT
jgi:hypothetical protein